METQALELLLRRVRDGELDVTSAVESLRRLPFENLGYARPDLHRHLRTGTPEVIFAQGKTPEQVRGIAQRLAEHHVNIMATRAGRDIHEAVAEALPCVYHDVARILVVRPAPVEALGHIAVVCAGTSDLPVAEEAAVTAETLGNRVTRHYDVGVAGIHRLFDVWEELRVANALVVVAGMEGALASVVGGLVSRPVIAVPTSVGYGASFGGLAALLAMLNSCASGVSVVNIDNGFGAAFQASLINRLVAAPPAPSGS